MSFSLSVTGNSNTSNALNGDGSISSGGVCSNANDPNSCVTLLSPDITTLETNQASLLTSNNNLNDSNRIMDLASGKVLYMPSPYGLFYKWDKIAVNYGYYGANFSSDPEVVLNSNPNNLGDPLSNPGRQSNLNYKVNYTIDLYSQTYLKCYIKNNRFLVNEITNLPYDLSQGGVLENSNPGDVRHAHSAVCAWDFLNNRYSASYRNYTANSTDISHSPDPWDVADPNDPTKPGYLSDASGGDGVTLAPGHWMYFSTTPEGAIKIREKANALEPNNKGWFADGTPPPFQSLEHASAYATVAKEYIEENQQAQLLANKSLVNTGGQFPEVGGAQTLYLYDATWTRYYWDKIVPGIGYYGGYFTGDPNTAPKLISNLNNSSTNPTRIPDDGTNINYTAEFVGLPYKQTITDRFFVQEAENIPHDISAGGIGTNATWGGNIHSFYCAWDLSNSRYSADYRLYESDASYAAGFTNPKNWIYSQTADKGIWPDSSGGDGITGLPYSWKYFSTTPEGAKKIRDNIVVAGKHMYDPVNASGFIAIANANRVETQQSNMATLCNNIDTMASVAKSGLDKYTSADVGPGWSPGDLSWNSGGTNGYPPAGLLVADWLKAQRVSERDVSYGFPSVALTKYDPAVGAILRTYWANGPFVFPYGQTEKNVTQIHTFTVGLNGSTASRKGKLYGTIHEGMDFKPAYHCDEVMDLSQIMVVDLSGKRLKVNYETTVSSNANIGVEPAITGGIVDKLGGGAIGPAEDYFTLEDSSFNTFLYLFQVQPYQFEIISSPPSAENDWVAGYAYAPSGEMMNGDHVLMIEYDPSDFSIVRTTGYNTGMPNGLANNNNFQGYNVYSPGWHTAGGMDLVAKIGMGSAQREFMAKNPGVTFQSVGVLDTRLD